jgi:hypothetical protein
MAKIVRFKRAYRRYNPGEVAGFTPAAADKLIAARVAEEIPARPTKKSRRANQDPPPGLDRFKDRNRDVVHPKGKAKAKAKAKPRPDPEPVLMPDPDLGPDILDG